MCSISSYSNSFHYVDRVHTHRNLHTVLHTLHGNDDVLHLDIVNVLHDIEWPGMARVLRLSVCLKLVSSCKHLVTKFTFIREDSWNINNLWSFVILYWGTWLTCVKGTLVDLNI